MARLGRMMLVVALAASTLSVCPGSLCSLLGAIERGCCAHQDGLSAPDCCGDTVHAVSSLVYDRGEHRTGVSPPVLGLAVAFTGAIGTPGFHVLAGIASDARGLGPPGPLVAKRTSLLL